MSYPINQALTYTAVAQTQGTADTFNYAWAFDDSTTGNVASLAKTWTTAGVHSATVTATDTTTGGTASAIKSVNVTDWSTFAWTSSGLKIMPTASSGFGAPLGAQAKNLIVSGNLIINAFDYYTPQTIVVFDGAGITRNEYSGFLGTVGSPTAAFLLTSGPNLGKVLLLGSGTGRYGFFDPTNGNFVTSPNTTPSLPAIVSLITSPYALIGNGKVFVHGTDSGGSLACMIYDPVVDSWSTANGVGSATYMDSLFTLPSGNILAYKNNSTSTWIYNYLTATWSAGPTIPANSFSGGTDPVIKLNDGRLMLITASSTPVQATWKEGDASFVLDSEAYPFLSQYGTASSNYFQDFVLTQDGIVINTGGAVLGSFTYYDVVSFLHMPDGAWTNPKTLPTSGFTYKKCFAAGRAWRSTNGILEYSSVWV